MENLFNARSLGSRYGDKRCKGGIAPSSPRTALQPIRTQPGRCLMPASAAISAYTLTHEEYAVIQDFSVLYSGGLDSCAVPLIIGANTTGKIELWPSYTSTGPSARWSKRHTPELQRVLGERTASPHRPDRGVERSWSQALLPGCCQVPRPLGRLPWLQVDGHHLIIHSLLERQRLHLLERRGSTPPCR